MVRMSLFSGKNRDTYIENRQNGLWAWWEGDGGEN